MRLILLGPPGAGKGTQAARVSEMLDIPRISSGDLFRDHQTRSTDLGRLAQSYMKKGVLVPDDVTIRMVMEWIWNHRGNHGFLLDGFPRTKAQAEALDLELEEEGGIDIALYIRVSHSELESRLGNRLVCRDCQAPYNTRTAAPECPGVCECGGELYQRDDDKSEAVSERIKTYMQQTEPLVDHYREVGKLREVDGELSIKQVGEQVMSVLEQ